MQLCNWGPNSGDETGWMLFFTIWFKREIGGTNSGLNVQISNK